MVSSKQSRSLQAHNARPQHSKSFCALLFLLFVLMLLMNALSPWVADDYHYAYSFATNEKLDSIWDIFPSLKMHANIMNGRYTPHFLVQLFTLLPWWVFDLCNSAVFVLMILGMHRLVCGPGKYDIAMLCALTAATFILVPGFGPSFLWMAGSCNYLWCDVLLIWLLVPFADAILDRKKGPSIPVSLLMIPAALFFGNMSENVSASGIMLMGLAILWLMIRRKPVRWWMLLTFLAAFIGFGFLLSAPADSTKIRYSTSSAGAVLDQFQLAADYMIQHGTIPAIASLLLFVLSWHNDRDHNHQAVAAGMFLAAMASNYVMAASPYYPDRAFTGTTLLLICCCALLLSNPRHIKLKTAVAACLLFIMGTTQLYVLPDMYKCYAMYNDREAQVEQAVSNGETSMTTFGISSRSRYDGFYQLYDLTIYPEATANVYYARYHGLDSIVIERLE